MATPKRPYSSPLRADQARLTRRRVVDAARDQFVAHGYTGATLARVARDAGVSLQTVYNTVGGKAALLSAAYDMALAGDDEPVPIAERPAYRAMLTAGDAHTCLDHYAALSRDLAERAAPLVAVILAEAGNPDVRALAEVAEQQRARGTAGVARHVAERFGLRPDLTAAEAADILWALTAPETAVRLLGRGWTWDRYQSWLADTMVRALV
ncbi:MAG TPA: TetR/AcrR family transcriptional regulator [Acidimicrobiales bacterium]|nr:TetR/AcrR family transcriptional regulator [Acidimicrobiales bacterium]